MGAFDLEYICRNTNKVFPGRRVIDPERRVYEILDLEKNEVVTLSSHHLFKGFKAAKKNKKPKISRFKTNIL